MKVKLKTDATVEKYKARFVAKGISTDKRRRVQWYVSLHAKAVINPSTTGTPTHAIYIQRIETLEMLFGRVLSTKQYLWISQRVFSTMNAYSSWAN